MDRERNVSFYEWCVKNGKLNLLKNWDGEKNGGLTTRDIAQSSKAKYWWKCCLCGHEYYSAPGDLKRRKNYIGCVHCKGNKYVDLGRHGDYTVYCHKTPDGKRYIGFTGLPIKSRFARGKGYWYGRFGDAVKKYGWDNIEHIVLDSGLTKEEASDREIYYINFYNTLDERYGYNIATGGINGKHFYPCSEETKEKIRRSNLGRKATAETRANMSKSHIGKDNHKSKEIYQMDKYGNIIASYPSCKQAAISNGYNYKALERCACGQRKTYKGYVWKYVNEVKQ